MPIQRAHTDKNYPVTLRFVLQSFGIDSFTSSLLSNLHHYGHSLVPDIDSGVLLSHSLILIRKLKDMLAAIRQLKDQAGMVTDVDRRKCSRRVPMKVLVLGMPRTDSTCRLCTFPQNHVRSLTNADSPQTRSGDARNLQCLSRRRCVLPESTGLSDVDGSFEAKYHGKGTKFSKKEFDQLLGHCQVGFLLHRSSLELNLLTVL